MPALLLTLQAVLALSYAPPAPPPLGWEAHIAPGFDPPIEYVLVYDPGWHPNFQATEQPRALMERWGPDAVPVLQKLYRDPAWASYHGMIWDLLAASGAPKVKADLEARLADLMQRPTWGEEVQRELLTSLHQYREIDDQALLDLFEQHLNEVQAPFYGALLHTFLNHAIQNPTPDLLALAERVPASNMPPELREGYEKQLELLRGRLRAQEPMLLDSDERREGEAPAEPVKTPGN